MLTPSYQAEEEAEPDVQKVSVLFNLSVDVSELEGGEKDKVGILVILQV